MTFLVLFTVFFISLIAFYVTYTIGRGVGFHCGMEYASKVIEDEFEKRKKKIDEDRLD